MIPKIFISYNPGIEVEQSTALRLQTISSLYNAMVLLPDRSGTGGLKDNTKQRILNSTVFIMFSTDSLSKEVIDEVNFALHNKKMVIVFYDERKGKNLNTSKITNNNFHEKMFNPETTTPNELLDYVKNILERNNSSKKDSGSGNALLAFLGIGLGLLLLKALTDDDEDDYYE